MRPRHGFTMMEILLVVVLISALAIGLLALLDPLEQIRRAQDSSVFVLMKDVHGAIARAMMENGGAPWSQELTAVPLASDSGKTVMATLITNNEFKKDAYDSNRDRFGLILISAPRDGSMYYLCYQPRAKANQMHKDNKYDDIGGLKEGCPNKDCYTCLGSGSSMQEIPTTVPVPTGIPQPTEPPGCQNFGPEYPTFAWTCNYSSKWEQYDCTNYCVFDLGCGGGKCKVNERRLEKNYSAPANPEATNCFNHRNETREEYCIAGKEANCGYKNYRSDPTYDYHWGCSNPRRPYEWVQYQ